MDSTMLRVVSALVAVALAAMLFLRRRRKAE
jgi:LPXTG-motif cell wall-anchored protein